MKKLCMALLVASSGMSTIKAGGDDTELQRCVTFQERAALMQKRKELQKQARLDRLAQVTEFTTAQRAKIDEKIKTTKASKQVAILTRLERQLTQEQRGVQQLSSMLGVDELEAKHQEEKKKNEALIKRIEAASRKWK